MVELPDPDLNNTDSVTEVSFLQMFIFLIKSPKGILIIPTSFFMGMSLGFMFTDYVSDISNYTLGNENGNYILGIFYLINAICCYVYGYLCETKFGRRGVISCGFIFGYVFLISLLFWKVFILILIIINRIIKMIYQYQIG